MNEIAQTHEMDEAAVEEWLATRKRVGQSIDPESAEVDCTRRVPAGSDQPHVVAEGTRSSSGEPFDDRERWHANSDTWEWRTAA
jgi:hypothetical protein